MGLGPVGSAQFERCTFLNVKLSKWLWDEVDLIDCSFSGLFRKGTIWGKSKDDFGRRNEIHGNDFASLKVDDFGFFGGVDLSVQQLPRKQGALVIPDVGRALRAMGSLVVSETDPVDHGELDVIMKLIKIAADSGQKQVWFDPANFVKAQQIYMAKVAQCLVVAGAFPVA